MELLVIIMFGIVTAFAIDSWIESNKTKERTRKHLRVRRIYEKALKRELNGRRSD